MDRDRKDQPHTIDNKLKPDVAFAFSLSSVFTHAWCYFPLVALLGCCLS